MVLPMTATLLALRTSCSVNVAAAGTTGQARMLEVIRRLAHDLGVPVLVAGGDLGAVAHFGADAGDAGDFAADGLGILGGQRAGAAPAAC